MSQRDRRRAGRAFAAVVVAVMGLAGSCRTVPRTEPQIVPSPPPAAVDLRVPPVSYTHLTLPTNREV